MVLNFNFEDNAKLHAKHSQPENDMILVYSFSFGTIAGLINYLYFRRQGYTSYTILILGVFAFSAIAYMFLKLFV